MKAVWQAVGDRMLGNDSRNAARTDFRTPINAKSGKVSISLSIV